MVTPMQLAHIVDYVLKKSEVVKGEPADEDSLPPFFFVLSVPQSEARAEIDRILREIE